MQGFTESASGLLLPPHALEEANVQELVKSIGGRLVQTDRGMAVQVPVNDDADVQKSRGTMDEVAKAVARAHRIPQREDTFLDLFSSASGILDPRRVTGISFGLLRKAVDRMPVLRAFINMRKNQGKAYAKRPLSKFDKGFRIRLKSRKSKMTPGARKRAEQIEETLIRCGYKRKHSITDEPGVWDPEEKQKAVGFREFTGMMIEESLIIDQACCEIARGEIESQFPIVYFYPTDGANIRKTDPELYTADVDRRMRVVSYVQLETGGGYKVLKEYEWRDLSLWVRNRRTDVRLHGLGYSEVEQCLEIIIGLIYGFKYNKDFFDNSRIPPVILTLVGKFGPDVLEDFKQQMRANVGGVANRWNVPVLKAEPDSNVGVQVARLLDSERMDMMWANWMDLMIAIIASVMQCAPEEAGFKSWSNTGNTLQSEDPEARIEQGRDKGLVSIMESYAEFMTTNFVERVDEDFEFGLQNLIVRDEQAAQSMRSQRLQNGLTVINDERAEQDEPPIRDPIDMPLFRKIDRLVRQHMTAEKLRDVLRGLDMDAKRQNASGDRASRIAKAIRWEMRDRTQTGELIRKAGNGQDTDDLWETLTEEDIADIVHAIYERAGGEYSLWPDAPVNCMGAMQVWMQDHQQGQQQPGMEGMGGDEQGDQPQGEEGQPGDEQYPPDEQGDDEQQAYSQPRQPQPTGQEWRQHWTPEGAQNKQTDQDAYDQTGGQQFKSLTTGGRNEGSRHVRVTFTVSPAHGIGKVDNVKKP